jgi:hypothetical protein
MVVLQVPGDGVRAVVEPFAGEFPPEFDDQVNGRLGQPVRAAVRPT